MKQPKGVTTMKQTNTPRPGRSGGPAALPALALLFLLLLLPGAARAQWATNGPGTMTTTTNSVGVGTANPAYGRLQVNKTVRIDDDSGSAAGSDTITGAPGLYIGTTGGGGHLQYNSGGGLDLWQFSEASWRRTITFARTGFVGIGTTSPLNQFHVNSAGFGMIRVSGSGSGGVNFRDNAAGANQKQYQWYSRAGKFYMALTTDDDSAYARANILVANSAGNVGVGTESPGALLHADRAQNGETALFASNNSTGAGALTTVRAGLNPNDPLTDYAAMTILGANWTPGVGGPFLKGKTAVLESAGSNFGIGNLNNTEPIIFYTTAQRLERMRISADGSVGIGTAPGAGLKLDVAGAANVGGNLSVAGNITGANIQATYQDVAEWVPSTQKLRAGTVVVLDAGKTNHVLASTTAYDTKVAGVVSEQPGVILGVAGEGKVKVATTGRVRVKVDAARGAIHVGDLLVTSGEEGVAMKSTPVDLGGVRIHRPGTIIGKALEPLESGTGEILVLLSLQ
jgi:hypothetical protein